MCRVLYVSVNSGGSATVVQGPLAGGYLMFGSSSSSGTDLTTQGWLDCQIQFKAQATETIVEFNYSVLAQTSPAAHAAAVLAGEFGPYTGGSLTSLWPGGTNRAVQASSEVGNPDNEFDFQSDSDHFYIKFQNLTLGKDYLLALKIDWLLCESYSDGGDAYAEADKDLRHLYPPPAVPLPGGMLLLGAGLVRLLSQMRKGKK